MKTANTPSSNALLYVVGVLVALALGLSVVALWVVMQQDGQLARVESLLMDTQEASEDADMRNEEIAEEGAESPASQGVAPENGGYTVTYASGEEPAVYTRTVGYIRAHQWNVADGCVRPEVPTVAGDAQVGGLLAAHGLGEETAQAVLSRVERVGLPRQAVQVCVFGSRPFVVYVTGSLGHIDELVGDSFVSYQPVDGIMDAVFLLSDGLWSGHIVATSGYGDAGSVWWANYELDEETRQTRLIEACTDYGVGIDLEDVPSVRELSCKKTF